MEVIEGSIIAERYRVERVIGRGGMGVVVAAVHIGLDERVAIKLLLRDERDASVDVARFLQEARIAAKIKSEHVARVSDVGTLDDGTPFLVMEHLTGHDLARHLREHDRLPIAQAIDFIVQVCEGLAEAHALGIVHRDLKPSNLFLTRRRDGTTVVKVLDFGVSKLLTPGPGGALTRTTDVVGSPLYMSPEQMLSAKHVDARTDVWALGVILYELVSGDVPWVADTLAALCAVVLEMPAPLLSVARPDAPIGLQAVINRCLAKNPSERFADLGELAVALAPFAPPASQPAIERIARIVGLSIETRRVAEVDVATTRTGERTVADSAPPPAPTVGPTMLSPIGLASSPISLATTPATAARTLRAAITPPQAEPPVRRASAPAPRARERDTWTLGRGLTVAGVTALMIATGVYALWKTIEGEHAGPRLSAPGSDVVSPPAAAPSASQPAVTPAIASATPAATAPSSVPSARKSPPPATSLARPHPADVPDSDFGTRHLGEPTNARRGGSGARAVGATPPWSRRGCDSGARARRTTR